MEKYKIELSENEFWKLLIFLIQFEDKPKELSETYNKLRLDLSFNEKQRETFANNQIYYEEMYKVIHSLKNKLDDMPF